jgi:GrpB-like predicted nucleotidyltransferase (UPF0157 family)
VIIVVDYDLRWPIVFESLRAMYSEALVGVPVMAIEHVGSTAVEGLAAKPVIDIDIVVATEQVGTAIAAMEGIGFRGRGEMGISQRWAFHAPAHLPPTNTYVVEHNSLALRNHLGVRDVLRVDAELRNEYADLKRTLARSTDDISTYIEAKSALLGRILERAGLTDDERLAIEVTNRSS